MTVVTGAGNNLYLWSVFTSIFSVTSSSPTGFNVTGQYGNATLGNVAITGNGFTYSATSLPNGTTAVALTGGTITGVFLGGSSNQSWSGLSVSGVAAFNAIAANDQATFNNLFFGGNDTFSFTNINGNGGGVVFSGLGGDDTFNISNGWPAGTIISGGSGNDTLNIAGGDPGIASLNVTGVERINLGAGYDYRLNFQTNLIDAGNTVTIDGSALGASNHLIMDSTYNISGTFAGNLMVYGGAGDDTFEAGKGSNTFVGGGGTDTVDFTPSQTEPNRLSYGGPGVTANLSISTLQPLGGLTGGSAAFIGIENLIGTPWSDTLTGDDGNNILDGGAGGADVLNGGAGNDTLIARGANSVLNGGAGDDTLIMFNGTADGGPGTDTVVLNANFNSPPYMTITNSNGAITITDVSGDNVTLTNVEYVRFNDRTISLTGPTVTTNNGMAARNQLFALSTLFSVTDFDGNAITKYQLLDTTTDPNSGHFIIGGVAQPDGTVIEITPGQLATAMFVTGKVNDNLQIRAFDGIAWSAPDDAAWSPFTISVPADIPPVVTTANVASSRNQTLAASSLFTVSDADGDAITEYQLWDGNDDPLSGYFVLNGVAQAAKTVIDISPAQLAQLSFVTGKTGDTIQIRASDGIVWSAGDSSQWSPFTINVSDNAPVVTTANLTQRGSQTLAASSLFTVSDADGDAITRYQLWDGNADPASGYFVVGGVAQPARTVIDIPASQLGQVSFVTGSVGDTLQIRASDGISWSAGDNAQWSPFTITVPVNHAPVVTTSSQSVSRGQTLAASSLFTVSDADGDAITEYQLWDGNDDPLSGYFVLNGVVQAAKTVIDLSPAQLAQLSFVTGKTGDTIQIRASDGIVWSAGNSSQWSPFTLTPTDNPPVVTTSNLTRQGNQTLAASSLFTVSDADGDAMTRYQLWDGSPDPTSGYFVVGGVVQAARTVIDISAAQLAQTSFVTGSAAPDMLQIRASDGIAWSAGDNAQWSPFTITVPVNHPPVVTTSNQSVSRGQTLALSSLFSVSDADGDAITKYQIWDGTDDPLSGHFIVNGVVQQARTVIDLTPAQLAQTSFVTGSVADNIQMRAFDGTVWSAGDSSQWSPFTLTPTDNAPVVTTSNLTRQGNQTLAASSLFTVSDADGDAMTRYQLWDGNADPASGYFVVGGVAQAARTVIDIPASQLGQVSFVTGSVGDTLQIRASDGTLWSAGDSAQWSPFTITVPVNHAPVVTTSNLTEPHDQTLALSSLFTVSDADGDAITKYQLWDGTADPNSGYFTVAGVAQAPRTVIEITAAQLGQVNFVTGGVGDNIQIRAFDGAAWSAGDSAQWSPFTITVPANHAPVVTTSDIIAPAGQSLSPPSLFSVSDADGDAITEYQFWDGTTDPNSGHFVVGGVAQAARTVIDIPASQLGQVSFLAGTATDMLQVRAFDGRSWSAADSAQWAPFHVAAS